MLGWFHRLLPREEKFFDLFDRHSQTVVAGAQALRAMLDGGEGLERHFKEVMARENEADDLTREVLIAVRRTFITPFDRSSIKDLVTSMDNTIDQMQKTAKNIRMFEMTTFQPEMKEMGDVIVTCAKLVREGVPLLRAISNEAQRLGKLTEEIAGLEGRADELHDLGMKSLYLTHRNASAMDFIVGTEVYDHLEKVVDRFDDVANEMHGIVIDHV